VNDDTFVPRGATPPDTAVLGVVVEIPQPWSQLLTEWRAKVGDNQAGVVPPHVTLLPPTEVPAADRAAIAAHLTEVARCHPPFSMHLSGTGTFRPVSEVVFIAVARGIGNCELLAGQVRKGPLDLRPVLEQAVQMNAPLMEARDHRLSVNLPAEPLCGEADQARLVGRDHRLRPVPRAELAQQAAHVGLHRLRP